MLFQSFENFLMSSHLLKKPIFNSSGSDFIAQPAVPEKNKISENGIEILNYESGFGKKGILTKICIGLQQSFTLIDIPNTVSQLPSNNFELKYHVYFRFCIPVKNARNFTLVTHIDSRMKMKQIARLVRQGVHLVCISQETKYFIYNYCKVRSIKNVNISVIDLSPEITSVRRKYHIGFFSNIYPDGRKQEFILFDLFKNLNTEDVDFYFMGNGLEMLIKTGKNAGFGIEYKDNFDEEYYKNCLTKLDLVVYTGLDEGAVSILDAISAGVPVAITPTGFHLDFPKSEYISFFNNSLELVAIINANAVKFSTVRSLLTVKSNKDVALQLLEIFKLFKLESIN